MHAPIDDFRGLLHDLLGADASRRSSADTTLQQAFRTSLLSCFSCLTQITLGPEEPASHLAAVLLRRHLSAYFAQDGACNVQAYVQGLLEGLQTRQAGSTRGAVIDLVKGCLVDVNLSEAWPTVVQHVRVVSGDPGGKQLGALLGTFSVAPLPLGLAVRIANDLSGILIDRFGQASGGTPKRLLRSMARVFRSLGYRHGEVDGSVVKAWRNVADTCLTCEASWEVYEGAAQLLLEMGNMNGWQHERSFKALVGVLTRVDLRQPTVQDVDVDSGDMCSLESLCTNGLLGMTSMPASCLVPVEEVVRLVVSLSIVTPRVVTLFEEEPNAFVVEMDGLSEDYLLVRHAAVRIIDDLVEAGEHERVACALGELARNVRDVVEMEAVLSTIVKVLIDWQVDAGKATLVAAAQVLTKRLLAEGDVILYTALWATAYVDGNLEAGLKVSLAILSGGSVNHANGINIALVLRASRVIQLAVEQRIPGGERQTLLPPMIYLMDRTNEDTIHILLESIKSLLRCDDCDVPSITLLYQGLIPKLELTWETSGHDPFIRDEIVEIYVALIEANTESTLPLLLNYLRRSVKAIPLYRLVRDQAHPSLFEEFSKQFAKDLCNMMQVYMPNHLAQPSVVDDVAGVFMDHTALLEDTNAMVKAALRLTSVLPDETLRIEVTKHVADTCAHRSDLTALRAFALDTACIDPVGTDAFVSAFAGAIVLVKTGDFLLDLNHANQGLLHVLHDLLQLKGPLPLHAAIVFYRTVAKDEKSRAELPKLLQLMEHKAHEEKTRLNELHAKSEEPEVDEGFLWSGINFDDENDNAEVLRRESEELARAEQAFYELLKEIPGGVSQRV